MKSGVEAGNLGNPFAGLTETTIVSRPGSGKGSGRRRTALTTLKMAVLAPMPSASASTATAAKPGLLPRALSP